MYYTRNKMKSVKSFRLESEVVIFMEELANKLDVSVANILEAMAKSTKDKIENEKVDFVEAIESLSVEDVIVKSIVGKKLKLEIK